MQFSVSLAPFQVLGSHVRLAATMSDDDNTECFRHRRKFYRTTLCWRKGSFLIVHEFMRYALLFSSLFSGFSVALSCSTTQPSRAKRWKTF